MTLLGRKAGSISTKVRKGRVLELLNHLEDLSKADREHGRLVEADKKLELVELFTDYMRISEGGFNAQRETIKILEAQMASKGGCNQGMVKPSGTAAMRGNPSSYARNNLAKGGVNAKWDLEKSGKTGMGSAKPLAKK